MVEEKNVPIKTKFSAWWIMIISFLGLIFVFSGLTFAAFSNPSLQEINSFLLQIVVPVVLFSIFYLFSARLIFKRNKMGFWLAVSALSLKFFLLIFLFFTIDNFMNLFAAFLVNLKAVPLILLIVDRRNFFQVAE